MIHPLSSVHTDACIADGVEIGPFVTVAADVEIGEGTRILSNAVVMDGARIGRNCTIFPGAVVGAIPQDLKFKGEYTLAKSVTTRFCVNVSP